MTWTTIRIKDDTLDIINKAKAKCLLNNIDISKDDIIKKSVNNMMVNKEWKNKIKSQNQMHQKKY